MARIADYEIVETIGAGNHGVYHTARPPSRLGIDDELVTLKMLDHLAGADDFRRIANELRILHALRSPHLVELLDAGSVDGRMFIATRHYPEGTLERRARASSIAVNLKIVADAARGADAMHGAGVAHRDIHPGNVFVDRGRGRLADLGLAQTLTGATATIGTGPIGSLAFIDPELIWGGEASRATDIWSLGLTAHGALSDVDPYGEFPTDSLFAAFRHVVHTTPQLDPALPPAVSAVIARCLAPVEERFRTAAELADALDALARESTEPGTNLPPATAADAAAIAPIAHVERPDDRQ